MGMVKATQINLHHSKAASAALLLRMCERREEFLLVQEPWIFQNRVCGLGAKGYKQIHANGPGKIRACILVKSDLNIFFLSDYSDEDTVAVVWDNGASSIIIVSSYMAHDGESPPQKIRQIMNMANRERLPVIIGADSNAHHVVWGSSDTNIRGESLFDFILCSNLDVANVGSEPTFVIVNRKEVLDITLVSTKRSDLVREWRVSNDCSFSDHRYIEFEISIQVNGLTPKINRKKTNWEEQRNILSNILPEPPIIHDWQSLELAVGTLTSAFELATSETCRPSICRGRTKPLWWSPEIARARKESRRLFNEAKRLNNWSAYKSSVNKFKNLIRNAKRRSWRSFCNDVEDISETCRLRKILSSFPTTPGYIKKQCGSWTTSGLETLEVLLDSHFPGSHPLISDDWTASPNCDNRSSPIPVNEEKILWAIKSFGPYKSPGPDGIIPADLQKNAEIIVPWLIRIYTACLRLSYIPTSWTRCSVVFIPKGGKTSHTSPKDFRPISLSSFLLKTLERIIDLHLRMEIRPNLLSASQHAYTKGKSVETALHTLVGFIEKSIEQKEYTLVAFLDIEGAFNNVKPEVIRNALERLNIHQSIISLIWNLLTRRVIISTLGRNQIYRTANRGTPQGGVLSPLLWNLALNSLLMELDSMKFKTVAYADDIAVAVSGKYPDILSQRLQDSLRTISGWSSESGLSVNPQKTELVLFTRRYKVPAFSLPNLNGSRLRLSDSAKYLGIYLDPKLSWQRNVQSRADKAAVAIYTCRRAIGKTWGLKPRNSLWLFNMVIKPILTYGALVWWEALDKTTYRQIAERILRTSALMITGAMRTTSSKALFTLLHWLPADLMVRQLAMNSAVRLDAAGAWKRRTSGHARILDYTAGLPDNIDYRSPTPMPDRKFTVLLSDTTSHDRENGLIVYTDGSKSSMGVGGGVYIPRYRQKLRFKLHDQCSILQAEISAIRRAANWVRYYRIYEMDIHICTDSKAAIKSLSGVYTTSTLVYECRMSLNEIARHSNLELIWVPGHRNVPGNEIADELAKSGARMHFRETDEFVGVPLKCCKAFIQRNLFETAQTRWSEEVTCRISRLIWPQYDCKRTAVLEGLPRAQLRILVAVVTGHCWIGAHARRLNLPYNDFCRSCQNEEEDESVEHLLCHCPAFSERRAISLGSPVLQDLAAVSNCDIRELNAYIRSTGWFNTGINGEE